MRFALAFRAQRGCPLTPPPLPLLPPPAPQRQQDYERAFAVFERVVCLQPDNSKAWVSWAQAEKRATRGESRSSRGKNSDSESGSGDCSDGGGGSRSTCSSSSSSSSSPYLPSPAVAVLQAGLSLNRGGPPSATAPLAQAWALHELQRGNARAAVALLARAVRDDPERCSPVLRWAPVVEAAREAEAAGEGRGRRGKEGEIRGSKGPRA